jgi:hypothetical protein
MEAADFPETLVTTYETIWWHSQDHNSKRPVMSEKQYLVRTRSFVVFVHAPQFSPIYCTVGVRKNSVLL